MDKLRVFLADDHQVIRTSLKAFINGQADMEVIGEADDGIAAVERVCVLKPDVVVMDMSMARLNGAQATQRLKQECPEVKVLALTMHEDRCYLRQLLDAGAAGYVLKRSAADELIRAIRTVHGGGVYLDPNLVGKVVASFIRKPAGKVAVACDLSERETEVVTLIAKGYSNKEISSQLNVGVRTVETYKSRCLEKLGFTSRTELVRYALQQGWLQAP